MLAYSSLVNTLGILRPPQYCNPAQRHTTANSQGSAEEELKVQQCQLASLVSNSIMVLKQTTVSTFCTPNDVFSMLLQSGNYIKEHPAYQIICSPLSFKITEMILASQK